MSASQHFLLPLMSGWQDHSAFHFLEAVVKRFLNTPSFCLLSSPSVACNFKRHTHPRLYIRVCPHQSLFLPSAAIYSRYTPQRSSQSQAAGDFNLIKVYTALPSLGQFGGKIWFCKLLPIKQIVAYFFVLHWYISIFQMCFLQLLYAFIKVGLCSVKLCRLELSLST